MSMRLPRPVRQHKVLVSIVVLLGLLGGVGYAFLNPPLRSSAALVILPKSARSIATQVVIAQSDPVLRAALPKVSSAQTIPELRRHIRVRSLTAYVLSVTARAKNAGDAETTANAVANSYIAYVGPRHSPVGSTQARILDPATETTGTGLISDLLLKGVLGALIGFAVALLVAISRNDRRLRERDDIANSIGVPVLASVPVSQPADAAAWTRLLDTYKPGPVDAWQLRTALQQVGMADHTLYRGEGGFSIAVLSFASDIKALALGPQLAVFAASQGIATELVIGPQQDPNVTAALRAACASPSSHGSKRPGLLRVTASNQGDYGGHYAALIISVIVLDVEEPKIPDTMRTTASVIGVSASASTAEQMARIAVVAAADNREVSGILVANPEPTDRTNGRIPRPPQPSRHRPTRAKSFATEIKW
jgi:capsular polysaccharide biosynthesis protein